MVICDESHNMKNPRTKRSEEIPPLLKLATVVMLLSGTPMFARSIDL